MAAYCFKKGPVIYVGRIYFKKAKYGFISVAKISGKLLLPPAFTVILNQGLLFTPFRLFIRA